MSITPLESATTDLTNDAPPVAPPTIDGIPTGDEAGERLISPVLITEQEVMFATAAAVPLQPAKPAHGLFDALRRLFVTQQTEARPKQPHYPPRCDYLQHSRMAREMERL